MIVATAGHIDHGKTTLVRALTGIDTDRLPEEKARGISIDLGFAHWEIPGGGSMDFVDVPGHERFVRNMVCGVCAIDHVLLVIAADDGVMPQTREHLAIVQLLGVGHGTVAITKTDRVTAERVAEVDRQAQALLGESGLAGWPVIPLCAARGEGMENLRRRLTIVAANLVRKRSQEMDLTRYIVDRVFSIAGSGTVVTGTLIAGEITPGDRLTIAPCGTEVRVRRLQRHGKASTQARAGERCALNLANIEHTALHRGDWLVAPQAYAPTDRIDARIRVLASEVHAIKHWTPVHLHIGAADVPARLALRRGATIAPGASAVAQLRLDRPVCAAHGDRLVIRDQSATRTLGGGIVIDPFASPRRTTVERLSTLAALELGEAKTALAQLLSAGRHGVDLDWLAQVFSRRREGMEQLMPPQALVFGTSRRIAFSPEWLGALQTRILDRLAQFHRDRRSETGLNAAALHQELAKAVDASAFAAILKLLATENRIVLQGPLVKLPGHDSTDNPRDLRLWQQLQPLMQDAGADLQSARVLANRTGTPLQDMRDFLYRKSITGELVRVTTERYALRRTLTALAEKARATARALPGGVFTAAQYRDRIGTGRTVAIEILECLDRLGITRREGNNRQYTGSDPPAIPDPDGISRR